MGGTQVMVRYYGPVGIESGYGQAANETCMALLAAGVDLEIQTYSPTGASENRLAMRYQSLVDCVRHDGISPRPNPDIVIVHTLPGDCSKLLEVAQIRDLYPRALCVAYTAWEASTLPTRIAKSLAAFDQVWVPSQETCRVLRARGGLRAFVVPHAYDDDSRPLESPPPRDAAAPFLFYYVGAWSRRKNPKGVISAFLRAFDPQERVELRIQSAGADPADFAQHIVGETGEAPGNFRVGLTSRRILDVDIQHLHWIADCFVTATRGEAWNLPAFDAMIERRHIITPGNLGSDDFLNQTSAWTYKSRSAPAGGEARIHRFPSGQTGVQPVATDITVRDDWQEPDIGELARRMRQAFLEQVSDLEVYYDPAERYGRRAVGKSMMRLMEAGTK